MLEFIVLMLVLVTMALTGFTVLAMLLVSGVFVLFGALAGMFALIIKLAPWLLLVLVVCGHAGAALFHHFVQHDATLARMLPCGWLSRKTHSDQGASA